VGKCKVWKLKDTQIWQVFEAKVEERLASRPDGDVEVVWGGLKKCLLDVAEEVCRKTRGTQWHSETWWWNDEVDVLVKEKRRLFRIYRKSKRELDKRKITEDKRRYDEAKRAAMKEISRAQEVERRKFGVKLDEENEREESSGWQSKLLGRTETLGVEALQKTQVAELWSMSSR